MNKHYLTDSALIIISCVTAIIYNSWPLGYLLNNQVAHHQFASELEDIGQPYNWLFMSFDILTGILVLYIALLIWRRFAFLEKDISTKIIATGFVVFGIFTAISALLPLNCQINDTRCGLRSSQILGLHNITGVLASIGLAVSLIATWRLSINRPPIFAKIIFKIITALWCLTGIVYLILSFYNKYLIQTQDIFLILSGFGVIGVCLVMIKLKSTES